MALTVADLLRTPGLDIRVVADRADRKELAP